LVAVIAYLRIWGMLTALGKGGCRNLVNVDSRNLYLINFFNGLAAWKKPFNTKGITTALKAFKKFDSISVCGKCLNCIDSSFMDSMKVNSPLCQTVVNIGGRILCFGFVP
jgi:hypothetical protein